MLNRPFHASLFALLLMSKTMIYAIPPPEKLRIVSERWKLTRDEYVDELRIRWKTSINSFIELEGHTLTVGRGGVNSTDGFQILHDGTLTSSESYLNIILNYKKYSQSSIYSVIADHKDHKVGIDLRGLGCRVRDMEGGDLLLWGEESNTFTGDVNIHNASLVLEKVYGAIAIQGDVNIYDGGTIGIGRDNQINDSSTITLNQRSKILFYDSGTLTEKIGDLVVKSGGIIDFSNPRSTSGAHPSRHFYLEDLIIEGSEDLVINGWEYGRDHLLVKKTSAHVHDALKRIQFQGYDRSRIQLEDYNDEYWQISEIPEPATYGAALGGFGLLLWGRLKRKRPRRVHRVSGGAVMLRIES